MQALVHTAPFVEFVLSDLGERILAEFSALSEIADQRHDGGGSRGACSGGGNDGGRGDGGSCGDGQGAGGGGGCGDGGGGDGCGCGGNDGNGGGGFDGADVGCGDGGSGNGDGGGGVNGKGCGRLNGANGEADCLEDKRGCLSGGGGSDGVLIGSGCLRGGAGDDGSDDDVIIVDSQGNAGSGKGGGNGGGGAGDDVIIIGERDGGKGGLIDGSDDDDDDSADGKQPVVLALELVRRSFRTTKALSPRHLANSLPRLNKQFRTGEQEDGHEFLRCLLDAMHEGCLRCFGPELSAGLARRTFVSRIFGGRLRSQTACKEAGYVSSTYDPFLDISLPIGTARSVEEVLGAFTAPETLEDFQCPPHNEPVRAERLVSVEEAPVVLSLHLKRFQWLQGSRPAKIHAPVGFATWLDLRPFMSDASGGQLLYELYAVIVHVGQSAISGHYVCYVKAADGGWYLFDDDVVTRVQEAEVLQQRAYVLFYIHRLPGDAAAEKAAAAAFAAAATARAAAEAAAADAASAVALRTSFVPLYGAGAAVGRGGSTEWEPVTGWQGVTMRGGCGRPQGKAGPPRAPILAGPAPLPRTQASVSVSPGTLAPEVMGAQAPGTSAAIPRTLPQGAAAKRRQEEVITVGPCAEEAVNPTKRVRQQAPAASGRAAPPPAPSGRAAAGDAAAGQRLAAPVDVRELDKKGFVAQMYANLHTSKQRRLAANSIAGQLQVPKVKSKLAGATGRQGADIQGPQQLRQRPPQPQLQQPQQPRHASPQQPHSPHRLRQAPQPPPPPTPSRSGGTPATDRAGSRNALPDGARAYVAAAAHRSVSADPRGGSRAAAGEATPTSPVGRRREVGPQKQWPSLELEGAVQPQPQSRQAASGRSHRAAQERGTPTRRQSSKGDTASLKQKEAPEMRPVQQRQQQQQQQQRAAQRLGGSAPSALGRLQEFPAGAALGRKRGPISELLYQDVNTLNAIRAAVEATGAVIDHKRRGQTRC